MFSPQVRALAERLAKFGPDDHLTMGANGIPTVVPKPPKPNCFWRIVKCLFSCCFPKVQDIVARANAIFAEYQSELSTNDYYNHLQQWQCRLVERPNMRKKVRSELTFLSDIITAVKTNIKNKKDPLFLKPTIPLRLKHALTGADGGSKEITPSESPDYVEAFHAAQARISKAQTPDYAANIYFEPSVISELHFQADTQDAILVTNGENGPVHFRIHSHLIGNLDLLLPFSQREAKEKSAKASLEDDQPKYTIDCSGYSERGVRIFCELLYHRTVSLEDDFLPFAELIPVHHLSVRLQCDSLKKLFEELFIFLRFGDAMVKFEVYCWQHRLHLDTQSDDQPIPNSSEITALLYLAGQGYEVAQYILTDERIKAVIAKDQGLIPSPLNHPDMVIDRLRGIFDAYRELHQTEAAHSTQGI